VGRPARCLLDLLAAAEAVSEHERVPGGADRTEQHALLTRGRDIEVVALESEAAGHTAAAYVEHVDLETEPAGQPTLGIHPRQWPPLPRWPLPLLSSGIYLKDENRDAIADQRP
jgi:hypothetical protein